MAAQISPRPMRAFGLAILIEAALLVGATAILANAAQLKPAHTEPVPIMLVAEEPPPEIPPPPKPLPPEPKPKVLPKPQVKLPPPPPQLKPPPAATIPVAQVPTAFTEPVPPPPPAPPPTVSGKVDPSIEYASRVRAAVQGAVTYPAAAIALRFSGRVRVEFHLRDAIPGEARVLITSGIGIIDRSALQSVQQAHYPAPPQELQGSDKVYQVWVEFTR
jgi:protein TonB